MVIYYHDPVEVDPATSWTGICPSLQSAERIAISRANEAKIISLFDYAQPDAVITVDGEPVVSIEQTQMNPSGHNIPQRFSFQVRASELGVPSILYYPEYSRRTFSDPNVRYAQIRVALAQLRLIGIFNVPAMSVFWPTDATTLLPDRRQNAHKEIARIVDVLVSCAGSNRSLLQLTEIKGALNRMEGVISKYARDYRRNPTVRRLLPSGFPNARTKQGIPVDPPIAAKLLRTKDFLESFASSLQSSLWRDSERLLASRDLTLVFTGTANKAHNDSEHPWPGYLTLIDILYLRKDGGVSPRDRIANLVYRLPVATSTYLSRANQSNPPTATYIVDVFSDVILLEGGAVPGRPLRGNTKASLLL